MEISVLALIGIALATMFFGYFFGLLEGRGQGYKRGRQAEAIERQEPVASPGPTAAAPTTEKQAGLLVLGLGEAGRPQLELDGRMVDALRVSPEQRRRLIDLMVMLKPWVDPSTSALPKPDASGPAAATPRTSPMASSSVPAPTTEGTTPPPAAPAGQLSLVAQIDAILQARLTGTALAGKAIRLAESLHGGAVVFVGSSQYDGVDRVPDPEIQAAIRAAIAEWEKRYTPG